MNEASKNELIERIEYILSYLLSRKYDREIKIYFKKVGATDGDSDTSKAIGEKQILDRET